MIRVSSEDMARILNAPGVKSVGVNAKAFGSPAEPKMKARIETPRHDAKMNKLEASYSRYLEDRRVIGEIYQWKYEPMKLRLADRTYYSPDFVVIAWDGLVEFHETKGFMRDDANVKIKVAAEQFQWARFFLVTRKKGEWKVEAI